MKPIAIPFALVLMLLSTATASAIPVGLSHHGRLLDATNQPVNDELPVQFTLYAQESGGAPQWFESWDVTFTNGYYAVMLGDVSDGGEAIPQSLLDGPLYLGIRIGDGPELQPRQRLGAAAWALRASFADAVAAGATITGATITGGSINADSLRVRDVVLFDDDGEWAAPPGTVPFVTVDEMLVALGEQEIDGDLTASRFIATETLGPPFEIFSDALVPNLNAHKVGGLTADELVTTAQLGATSPLNLVRNGSFEVDDIGQTPTDWNAFDATATVVEAGAHGTRSIEIAKAGGVDGALRQSVFTSSEAASLAGRTLTASLRVKHVAGTAAARLCLSDGPTEGQTTCATTATDSSWTRLVVRHTVGASPVGITIALHPTGAAEDDGTQIFDAVMLTPGPLLTEFAPHVSEWIDGVSIGGGALEDGSVTRAKLADGAVDGAKLADGSVGSEHLRIGAVDADAVAAGAIGTDALENDAVTGAKLAAGVVDTTHLADEAVTTEKVADASITSGKFAEGAVDGFAIAASAVDTHHLATGAVTAEKLAAGAVGIASIEDGSITRAKIAEDAIDTARLANQSVNAAKLASASVGSAALADGAVTTAKLFDGAVDGSKLAANAIGSAHFQAGAVDTAAIGSGAITGPKLATGAVGTDAIANDAVGSSALAPGAVTSTRIAAGAVGTGALEDGAVSEAKLAPGAVTATRIADGAVGTLALADEAITADKLAAGSISGVHLADGAVTTAKLGAGAVTTDRITDGNVIESKIGAGAVSEAKLATGAVTESKLGTGAVTADKLFDGAVVGSKLADGAVDGAKLAHLSVSTHHLAGGAVTTAKLGDGQVTTAKLKDGDITAVKLATGAVTAAKIVNGAVGTDQLAALGVTRAKLADGAVDGTKLAGGAVTSNHLSSGAVLTAAIGSKQVTTAKIDDLAVTSTKLGANAVIAGKIANDAVTTNAIAGSAVTTAKIGDSQVTTAKIGNLQVTEGKLAANAVTSAKLANNAVGPTQLASNRNSLNRVTGGHMNVASNGNVGVGRTPEAKLDVNGAIRAGAHFFYSSQISSTLNSGTEVKIGEFTMNSNSRNVQVSGEVRGQSANAARVVKFEMSIRTDTAPVSRHTFTTEYLDLGRGLEVRAYKQTNQTNRFVLTLYASSQLQNFGWRIWLMDRSNANIFQNESGHVDFNSAGWTRIHSQTMNQWMDRNLVLTGTLTGAGFGPISDARLKDVEGDYEPGLKELLGVHTRRFRYKDGNPFKLDPQRPMQGVVAQELMQVLPEAVSEGPDGYYVVNSDAVIWTMLNAIQDQQRIIESQDARLRRVEETLEAAIGAGAH